MSTKPYVLCVDDEPNVLRSYQRALRKENFELLIASSGLEALKLLKQYPIQVVVTDFRMAGMNGIELLQEVRKQNPQIRCAILSGYADEKVVQEALKLKQITRYLLKPIENQSLKNEIRELLISADSQAVTK